VTPARPHVLRAATAGALLLLVAALPGVLSAQDRWVVRTESATPVVALEVLVAAGPAQEDSATAGLAFLAARSVVEPIRPQLETLGAHLLMEGHKDAISFSLVAPPETWREASQVLLVALYRDPPSETVVLRERAAMAAELVARQASPADALSREVDRRVYGSRHPWGRPTVGTPATVSALNVNDVDDFLRRHVTAQRSVIAVVGPVQVQEVSAHLRPFFPDGRIEPLAVAQPGLRREQHRAEYNAITTWAAAVYPLREGLDAEAVRFLAEAAAGSLSFSAERRSIYDVRADVHRRAGGGELRIQVVVPPQEAERWAAMMGATVRRYARGTVDEREFESQLRYYRGRRFLALSTPEARAQELAREFLVSGRLPGLIAPVHGLTLETVRETARALGEPAVVLLGPFFAND
jgi:zinc protease